MTNLANGLSKLWSRKLAIGGGGMLALVEQGAYLEAAILGGCTVLAFGLREAAEALADRYGRPELASLAVKGLKDGFEGE